MRLVSYWLVAAIMALLGGGLAYAYAESGQRSSRQSFRSTLVRPSLLTLRQLKRTTPKVDPGTVN